TSAWIPCTIETADPATNKPMAAIIDHTYASRPYPAGCSASAARAARRSAVIRKTSLPASAQEWAASATIEAAPVSTAATDFATAMSTLAAKASITVRLRRGASVRVWFTSPTLTAPPVPGRSRRCRNSRGRGVVPTVQGATSESRVPPVSHPFSYREAAMTDYGHELTFGTYLTPHNADPLVTVQLAQLSEAEGLDLVTFQDLPYQPRFTDTWTLISWVAAQTQRIRLSGNVLNLPLRQPAVLARSVASLDLLSGGRVALGLGTGGFWDAIEAMGGPRRSGKEAVDALIEALASSAASGSPPSGARCVKVGRTTGSTAPSVAPPPPTTSRSGWAPTAPACCVWWAGRP